MIPTAEEFAEFMLPRGVSWQSEYGEMMIEFAKLHVKAALEAAVENAEAKERPEDYGTGETWVDEKSILDAYPLDNIK